MTKWQKDKWEDNDLDAIKFTFCVLRVRWQEKESGNGKKREEDGDKRRCNIFEQIFEQAH